MIKKSKFGKFIGCTSYPDCKATYSLPQGLPKPSKKTCKECSFPQVIIIRKGRRPFDYCINKECKLKLDWMKKQQEKFKEKSSKKKTTIRNRKK